MKKLFSLLTLALLTTSVWAANTYVKVTSADQIVAGQKYIVVNEDAGAGMGAITGGSTKFAAAIAGLEIAGNVVDIEGTDVVELTLGGEAGAYTFDMGDGAYIMWKSGNSLNTIDDDTDANALWSVIASGNGGYVLSNNAGAADPRILQYNANSGQERFACYKGTQKDAELYVQDASAVPVVVPAAPSLPEAQTFVESMEITITNNEAGADLYYSTDGLAWNAYNGPITITETTTVYAKATLDGVDSHVVSAKYTKVEPATDDTITFSPAEFENVENQAWTITKGGVTINCTSGTITDDQFRHFKSSTTTFNSTGASIQKIVFTCTASGTTKYGPGCFAAQDGYSYEGNVGTWEGDGNNIAFTAETNQVRATEIVVYLGEAPAVNVEAPVLSPIHNTKFVGSQEVTITCATEGATIYYTTDSVYQVYEAPITITETTTVKAYAQIGDVQSATVSAKYIKLAEVSNIAEGNALDNKVDFIFNGEAVVTYQNGSNLWIRDESGSGLIYGNQVPAMEQGTVINSGWIAQKYNFRGGLVPEFQYPTGVEASETVVAVEPFERLTLTLENVNEYVIMKGQTITAETDTTVNNYQKYFYNADGLVLYNQFGIEFTLEEGKTYDVVGTVTVYNELPQLYIISVTEAEEVPSFIRGDVDNDEIVGIADVTGLIDYILTGSAEGINLQAADVDMDQEVGIADVTALIDFILTGNW